MDSRLEEALDELERAETEMIESGEDEDDRLYTAACHVAGIWREIKTPKLRDLSPSTLGIAFSLDLESGKVEMRDVDG